MSLLVVPCRCPSWHHQLTLALFRRAAQVHARNWWRFLLVGLSSVLIFCRRSLFDLAASSLATRNNVENHLGQLQSNIFFSSLCRCRFCEPSSYYHLHECYGRYLKFGRQLLVASNQCEVALVALIASETFSARNQQQQNSPEQLDDRESLFR